VPVDSDHVTSGAVTDLRVREASRRRVVGSHQRANERRAGRFSGCTRNDEQQRDEEKGMLPGEGGERLLLSLKHGDI